MMVRSGQPQRRPDHVGGGVVMRLNAGGVCDNCGQPALAHEQSRCLDDAALDDLVLRVRLDNWFAIVAPAKDAYHAASKFAKRRAQFVRQGKLPPEHLAEAQQNRERLLAEYQAAIRRADLVC